MVVLEEFVLETVAVKVVELVAGSQSFNELDDEVEFLEEIDVNGLDEDADENAKGTHFPILRKHPYVVPQTNV